MLNASVTHAFRAKSEGGFCDVVMRGRETGSITVCERKSKSRLLFLDPADVFGPDL